MPFLVLDLEMSGTDPEFDEIVQIGAQLYSDDWKVLGEFLQNVCPEVEENLTAAAEEVHGLSKYDLREAPMLYDVLASMEEWVYKTLRRKSPESLKDITLVGQSVYFDLNFLKIGYNRLNLDWPFSNRLIDLYTITYFMEQALKANKMSTPKSLGLGAVAAYFGFVREDNVHNALEDAKLTADCIKSWMGMAANMKINS